MPTRLIGLLCGTALLMAAPAAFAADPFNASIRVENKAKTLVKKRTVTLADAPITNKNDPDPNHSCNGQSALGALHAGTGGDWGGTYNEGFNDFLVDTIKGETASGNDFFELWVNYKTASLGFCGSMLEPGDDVLVIRQTCVFNTETQKCSPPVTPLGVRVAKTIKRNTVRTIKVVDYAPSGKTTPERGAAVFVNGTKVGRTNRLGEIKVKGTKLGVATVYAKDKGHVRSETERVRVVK